ncbi:MAG: hypothetical protein RL748_3246 [Pseudomonadota bacterium]|jgi:hypothetical protein
MPDSHVPASGSASGPGLTSRLVIGLSETGFAILRGDGFWRKHYQVLGQFRLPEGSFNHESLTLALTAQIEQLGVQKLPLTLVLADDWVRYFLVAPPKNLSSLTDCQAAANLRFSSLYGDAAIDWHIDAIWDTRQPFLACAVPQALLSTIKQVAAAQKSALLAITPHFITSWNRWAKQIKPEAWLALVHGARLTLAAIDQGRICALRHSHFSQAQWEDKTWLPEFCQREALRLGLSMPTQLQVCGNLPGNWARESMGSLDVLRLDAGQNHLQLLAEASLERIISDELRLAALGAGL